MEILTDIHGMTEEQARIEIDRLLRTAPKGSKSITIVHGYRKGTILLDLVRYDYKNHQRVKEIKLTENPGETVFLLT